MDFLIVPVIPHREGSLIVFCQDQLLVGERLMLELVKDILLRLFVLDA